MSGRFVVRVIRRCSRPTLDHPDRTHSSPELPMTPLQGRSPLRTVSHGASSLLLLSARCAAPDRAPASGSPRRSSCCRHTARRPDRARAGPPPPSRRPRERAGRTCPAHRGVGNRRRCGPVQLSPLDSSSATAPSAAATLATGGGAAVVPAGGPGAPVAFSPPPPPGGRSGAGGGGGGGGG